MAHNATAAPPEPPVAPKPPPNEVPRPADTASATSPTTAALRERWNRGRFKPNQDPRLRRAEPGSRDRGGPDSAILAQMVPVSRSGIA